MLDKRSPDRGRIEEYKETVIGPAVRGPKSGPPWIDRADGCTARMESIHARGKRRVLDPRAGTRDSDDRDVIDDPEDET
jgi:hypothetical protein